MESAAPQDPGLAAVRGVVSVFLRTERMVRTYPIDNQMSQRALADLAPRLLELLPLEVELSRSDLLWEGTPLLDPERDRSDLPGRLYKDGIRKLALRPGLDQDELARMMVALATPIHPDDLSEDYVTQLWEADLPHVRVVAIDPYLDLDVPVEVLDGEEVPSGEVEAVGPIPETPDAEVPAPPETAFYIQPEDARRVAEEVGKTESCPPWSSFMGAVFDLLHLAESPERVDEVVALLEATFYRLVEDGRVDYASELLLRLGGRLPAATELPIREALERMAHPERLAPILLRVEAGESSPDDAERILLLMADRVPDSACALLASARDERTRRFLVDLLVKLGPPVLEPVLANLQSGPAESRGQFARVLGRLGDPRATAALVATLRSEDPSVRKEAIRGLAAGGDPSAKERLLRAALGDKDASVRVVALTCLGHARSELNCGAILGRLKSSEFPTLPDDEKDLLYEALGAAGTDEIVPFLADQLKPSWVPGRADMRTWTRAARALSRLGSEAAIEVLENGARSRRDELSRACLDALRGMGAGR